MDPYSRVDPTIYIYIGYASVVLGAVSEVYSKD